MNGVLAGPCVLLTRGEAEHYGPLEMLDGNVKVHHDGVGYRKPTDSDRQALREREHGVRFNLGAH